MYNVLKRPIRHIELRLQLVFWSLIVMRVLRLVSVYCTVYRVIIVQYTVYIVFGAQYTV